MFENPSSVCELKVELLCRVLSSLPSFNSSKVVYAVLERTEPSRNVVATSELLDCPVG